MVQVIKTCKVENPTFTGIVTQTNTTPWVAVNHNKATIVVDDGYTHFKHSQNTFVLASEDNILSIPRHDVRVSLENL